MNAFKGFIAALLATLFLSSLSVSAAEAQARAGKGNGQGLRLRDGSCITNQAPPRAAIGQRVGQTRGPGYGIGNRPMDGRGRCFGFGPNRN